MPGPRGMPCEGVLAAPVSDAEHGGDGYDLPFDRPHRPALLPPSADRPGGNPGPSPRAVPPQIAQLILVNAAQSIRIS
jgi:hypothetical protein